MVSTGLLILTSPPRILVTKLKHYLITAKQKVKHTLYIKLEPGIKQLWPLSRNPQSTAEQGLLYNLIPQIYSRASVDCSELDVRVLQSSIKLANVMDHHVQQFDLVLSDTTENLPQYLKHQFGSDCNNIHFVDCLSTERENSLKDNVDVPTVWNSAVLGGTFDRLHNGHKMLLSEALLRCRKQLTIGITDGPMIQKKILWELMEPLNIRMQKLREFLHDVDPTVNYKIVPIYDIFGPSTEDPDLNCIIVSQETIRGGEAVNSKRLEKGMKPLAIYVISLIEDPEHNEHEETKISSSSGRMRLLGSQLRPPEPRPKIPPRPYLIGLTGGIASGKSAIGRHLEKLGAGVIDCDHLAHQSYASGTELSRKLAHEFGNDILTKEGAVDRKALGLKIFGNEEKRQKLNALVWPEVQRLANSQVQELFMNGHSVVVLEAALLIEANWQNFVHQLWISIIPEKEAIRRVQERDKLTEDEALHRVRSQISNSKRVELANVVFCSLWDYNYTQQQVEKAWQNLQKVLSAEHT